MSAQPFWSGMLLNVTISLSTTNYGNMKQTSWLKAIGKIDR